MRAGSDSSASTTADNSVLERIARARQYKEDQGVVREDQDTLGTPGTSASLSATRVGNPVNPSSWDQPRSNSASPPLPPPALPYATHEVSSQKPDLDAAASRPLNDVLSRPIPEDWAGYLQSTPRRPGSGSTTEAADWMKGVMEEGSELTQGLDTKMRMEEFTLAREERLKQLGAKIITADPTYQPSDSGTKYQPKVSTWGVYPRPNNISETYGGGRVIKPGQLLEPEEVTKARNAAYEEALKMYKRKIGADVDPKVEAEANRIYEEGMQLFKAGQLHQSYSVLKKVEDLLAVRTKTGGLAMLQRAIILDSLGQNKEAEKMYKQVRNHNNPVVAKRAKQMLFGFEAMGFLKTEKLSYAVKRGEYDKYFRRFVDGHRLYVASEEELAKDRIWQQLSGAIAVVVLLGPVALFGALAYLHHPAAL